MLADSLATESRCAVVQRRAAALKRAARRLVKAHGAAARRIGVLPPGDAAYSAALRPGPPSTRR